MRKPVETSEPIHPVLAERWSPRSFEHGVDLSHSDITALLEAARWAPSANNLQPWKFIVAKHGDERFAAITASLAGFNKEWAPNASAFIVACLQLVLLSIIMVGQNVSSASVEQTINETHTASLGEFELAKEARLLAKQELAELKVVAADIHRLMKDIEGKNK